LAVPQADRPKAAGDIGVTAQVFLDSATRQLATLSWLFRKQIALSRSGRSFNIGAVRD